MDRFSTDQIDRQLGNWLREESATRAPAGLVEGVFARASRTPQVRRWWPATWAAGWRGGSPEIARGPRATSWQLVSALGGAAAVVVVVVGLALTLRPIGTGPGVPGGPSASPSPTASPTSSPTASPSPTTTAAPTAVPTVLGDLSAQKLDLGTDAAPIAVTEAFGSIWVADIHADDVRRFEPDTLRELARIPVPGAAWFAVADDALWVTSQTGIGISRIDPATNTVVAQVGDVPPCAAPVVAFDSIWQSACDADVFLRIDPVRNAVVDTIPAQGHGFLTLAGGRLITQGPDGLATLDPDTGTFTPIGNGVGAGSDIIASDGTTIWAVNGAGVTRIDPADGSTLASLFIAQSQAISFAGDHAWLATHGQGVLEIDLATATVRRAIPVLPAPIVPNEAGGNLWVTSFEDSALWKVKL